MEDPLDIYQDVIDISGDDKEVTEADNYPQKDELTDKEWRDELDDIRSEINRESYAGEAWVVRVIQEETDEVVEELEARDEADAEQIARGMEINMSPDFYTEIKNTAEEDATNPDAMYDSRTYYGMDDEDKIMKGTSKAERELTTSLQDFEDREIGRSEDIIRAEEDAINPDAKLDTFTTPFLEEEDRFRNDVDFNRPAIEVEDDDEDEEEIIMSLPAVEGEFMKLKDAIHISDPNDLPELSRLTGYSEAEIDRMMYAFAMSDTTEFGDDDDPYLENRINKIDGTSFESYATEDFGSNTIQGDDLITDGYPTDQEGFGRASWDDATIEDRKNWLSVNGFNTDDAWSPYYSLDSYIRSNLAKDLHVGGIKAMGSTY